MASEGRLGEYENRRLLPDVTGRILSNESINGSTSVNVNAAAGIYMFRLINGDNVKVQKVVVR